MHYLKVYLFVCLAENNGITECQLHNRKNFLIILNQRQKRIPLNHNLKMNKKYQERILNELSITKKSLFYHFWLHADKAEDINYKK